MRKEVIIVVVVAIILISLFMWQRQNGSFNQSLPTSTAETVATIPQTISEQSQQQNYTINVQYPKFSGISDMATENDINNQLMNFAQTTVTNFKNQVSSTPPNPNLPANLTNNLTVTYQVLRSDPKIISVLFNIENNQAGMAHPDSTISTFNYDVMGKKVLQLSDLFTPNSNYLQTLSTESQTLLNQQFASKQIPTDFVSTGTVPNINNFQYFGFSNDGLILEFPPYQVAAGFVGPVNVNVPSSSLQSILTDQAKNYFN